MEGETLHLTSFRGESQQLVWRGGSLKNVSLYKRIRTVGEGTYGLVSLAEDPKTRATFAIKALKSSSDQDIDPTVVREIKLVQSLRHPNVIRFDEALSGARSGTAFLRMELCAVDLDRYLRSSEPLGPNLARQLFQNLMEGLGFLHSQHLIHRDLKPANLLLTKDLNLKIADFGLARNFTDHFAMSPLVVTLWYRAPELVLSCSTYDYAIDLWSAGLILLELFTRNPVLAGNTELEQLHLITQLLSSPSSTSAHRLQKLGVSQAALELIPDSANSNSTHLSLQKVCRDLPQWAYNVAVATLTWDPRVRPPASKLLTFLPSRRPYPSPRVPLE